jgi:ATP-binding cassette subfamily C protein
MPTSSIDTHAVARLASFARAFARSVPLRRRLAASFLMVGAGLTEGVGLALLAPLVALVSERTQPGTASGSPASFLRTLGLDPTLPIVIGLFMIAIVCRAAFVRARDRTIFDLQHGFVQSMRRRLYRAIELAAWPFLAKERISHLQKALAVDVESMVQTTYTFLQIPALAAVAAVQLAIAFTIAPLLTLATLACGGLLAMLVRLRRGDTFAAGKRTQAARRATFNQTVDFLASLKLAKSHNAEELHRQAFEAAFARLHDSILTVNRRMADAQMLNQVFAAAMAGGFVYLGAEVWHLTTPQLLVLVAVFARLVPSLMQLQQSVFTLWQTMPAFGELERLIERCEMARENLDTTRADRLRLHQTITLSGVRLRYDKERGPDVLNGLDLEIRAGSIVALAGASGAGKSTLADLLLGLQVPDAGSVTVDGKPLTSERLAAWRRSIAYVPQENFLFNLSVRSNLQWAKPDASDEEIFRVLRMTGADAVIAAMPDGLDTVVGERGSRLSGGERQRLVLARALLRDPILLVLDEATSALDVDSERAVWSCIEGLRGKVTVVVIAHRLETLRGADRICLLDGGRIVQDGTWDALANAGDRRFIDLVRHGEIMPNAAE